MVFGHWNNYDLSLLSHGYSSLFLFNSIGSTCAFSSQYQRYVRILKVNETILTKRNFPVGTVLINVNLEHELALVLEVFYKSIYWNNEASVLVVNSNLTMGCFEASKSLRLAWGYNILKAYYLCPDLDGNSLIYTYNPFSSLATKSWNIIRVSNNETNNRWTLFSNKIIANETDVECYFDKTTNLDQYEVVVSVDVENPTLFTTGSSRVEEVLEVYPMIISMILSHIKANHTLLVYPIMTKYDKDKKPQGTFKAVVDGEVDIDARLKAITDQWKMQTNVVRGSHLLIVSRKVEVSGTKKFASALSMQIIVILVFAFGMFVAVSRLLLKLSWSNIYFEFIRTFTNAMQDHAFDKSTYFSERIVMIILILLTSGSSTYLLTLLSALNTVPDFEPIVETPRDLQHYPNMKLYAFASLPQELSDLVVSKIYQFDDLLDCVDKIKKNDHRVCICGFMMLGKCGIVETNLIHISRPVTTTRTSVSFQVRPDWPLLPKANWIIRRLFDSGIIMQYVKMCHKLPDPNDEDADPTSNDDLHFSFLLLLGGCFMELNNAAAALSWWLRLRQEPRMTPPVADEGTETKYYFGNQQEAAAAGRMGRNLDPIGGGNLVRRNLDSIGGGNLLRSVQQTPSRFARSMTEPTGGRGILRERHLSGRTEAAERQSGEAALRRDRPQRLQHVQAQHRRDRSDGLQRLQAQPRRDRPHGLQRVQAQLRRDRSGRLRRIRRQAQHRRDRSGRLRRLQSQAQLRRDRPQRRARFRQEVCPEEQQSQQQQAPSLKSSDDGNKISSNSFLPPINAVYIQTNLSRDAYT
uniref:Ionotropic glutamate receptor C-terminal domain-containing protein n=1 Tax=Trichogramma kaykai TaxID=54128 RepID=A0ABD2WL26_9HYME